MVSDNLESVKGYHPHDFLTRFDVHAVFKWKNHHAVVLHVHGVNFISIKVGDHGGSLFDHWNVNVIGDCSHVRDFLRREE